MSNEQPINTGITASSLDGLPTIPLIGTLINSDTTIDMSIVDGDRQSQPTMRIADGINHDRQSQSAMDILNCLQTPFTHVRTIGERAGIHYPSHHASISDREWTLAEVHAIIDSHLTTALVAQDRATVEQPHASTRIVNEINHDRQAQSARNLIDVLDTNASVHNVDHVTLAGVKYVMNKLLANNGVHKDAIPPSYTLHSTSNTSPPTYDSLPIVRIAEQKASADTLEEAQSELPVSSAGQHQELEDAI